MMLKIGLALTVLLLAILIVIVAISPTTAQPRFQQPAQAVPSSADQLPPCCR